MALKRVTLKQVRNVVQQRQPFTTSTDNLWATSYHDGVDVRYVVYSYTADWPLFVYAEANGQWFENADRYSITTSKHRSKSHPLCDTIQLPVEAMRLLAYKGYRELAKARLTNDPCLQVWQ